MLYAVYKSPRKAQTFLYIEKRDDFSPVPKTLLETFGKPELVMLLPLHKRELANADSAKVMENIRQQGYYLQIPPPEEDLLKTFVKENKVKENKKASGETSE